MSSLRRFYINVRLQGRLYEDDEGLELANLQAALEELLRAAHELRSESPHIADVQFEVSDPAGQILLIVPIPTGMIR